MKTKKTLPYAFIFTLVFIVSFLAGIKYGGNMANKNIEIDKEIKKNKKESTINKKAQQPQQEQTFILYQHEECDIEFIYPDNLVIKESTESASFTLNNKKYIDFNCSKALEDEKDENQTKTILFNQKPIDIKIIKQNQSDQVFYNFILEHKEAKDKKINVTINSKYYSLFERTLRYELTK